MHLSLQIWEIAMHSGKHYRKRTGCNCSILGYLSANLEFKVLNLIIIMVSINDFNLYTYEIGRVSVCLFVCLSAKNVQTDASRRAKLCMQVHVNTRQKLGYVDTPNLHPLGSQRSLYTGTTRSTVELKNLEVSLE